MIEFKKMPHGSYRYTYDCREADVWQVYGRGWLWTIIDMDTGRYVDNGCEPTEDDACEKVLKVLKV